METLECIKTRRSYRKYKPDPVPEELLQKIIEAGMWAPTGMNKQAPIIIAINDKTQRDRLMRLNAEIMGKPETDGFYGAPCVLVVLVDKNVPTYPNDGELVIENMLLAAHDLGLASCYIWRAKPEFEMDEGKAMLADWGIPEGDWEGVGHVIVGYPDCDEPKAPARKEGWVYRI